MDGGGDSPSCEAACQSVAVGRADREEVVDALRTGLLPEQLDRSAELVGIACGQLAASGIPSLQVSELDTKRGGLQAVQALVVPGDVMPAALETPEIAKAPCARRELLIVGHDRARVADGAKVLARIN